MNSDLEARIRTRAYHIWEMNPSQDGNAEQHWEEARRQLEAEGELDGAAPSMSADQSAERERGDQPMQEDRLQDIPDSAPLQEDGAQRRKK